MARILSELLDEGASRLLAAGIENPRLAAELFLRSILNLRRLDIHIDPRREVGNEECASFAEMVELKVKREPLQYIIGETEWFGLTIRCDGRALIPRPETEVVLERALELIRSTPNPRVADIGTGTGCIAIAVAENRADAIVYATDLSSGALQLAEENIALHNLSERIELRQGDLLSPLLIESPMDLIIANLPYVRESEWHDLMSEVRDHEPQGALVSGVDGLDAIRQLIADTPDLLTSGGYLVIEYGIDHDAVIRGIVERETGLKVHETIIDYNQRQRGMVIEKV